MKVYFVGAGPGDPELLTIRAERLLRACRICIYAGSLVSPGVMEIVAGDAERHDSAGMNLDEIAAVCRDARDRNVDVIRLHSGEPSVYGAIREQMNALDALGIAYEVVPGISAFQASAAAIPAELTAPEISQTVILTRTSGRTPPARKAGTQAPGRLPGDLVHLSFRGPYREGCRGACPLLRSRLPCRRCLSCFLARSEGRRGDIGRYGGIVPRSGHRADIPDPRRTRPGTGGPRLEAL